jgi:hypothetical protein
MENTFKKSITEKMRESRIPLCENFAKGKNNADCELDYDDYKEIKSVMVFTEECGLDGIMKITSNDNQEWYAKPPMFDFNKWKLANKGKVSESDTLKNIRFGNINRQCTTTLWSRRK